MITETRERNPLLQFLYILLRDFLTAGEVESIMVNHLEQVDPTVEEIVFSNPYIVAHAEDLMQRLCPPRATNDS